MVWIGLVLMMVGAQAVEPQNFEPEGERMVVEATTWLEQSSVSEPRRPEVAGLVMQWWTEHPDLTLVYCFGMFVGAKNKRVVPAVTTQALFGAGAHLIAHRDADPVDLHVAGATSALALYEAARTADRKARVRAYDELVEHRDAGTLRDVVAAHLAKSCPAESE